MFDVFVDLVVECVVVEVFVVCEGGFGVWLGVDGCVLDDGVVFVDVVIVCLDVFGLVVVCVC